MSYSNLYLHHTFLSFRKEAQLDEEGQFLVRIIYDDSKTYDLVAAASKVLSRFNESSLLWVKQTQVRRGTCAPRPQRMMTQADDASRALNSRGGAIV